VHAAESIFRNWIPSLRGRRCLLLGHLDVVIAQLDVLLVVLGQGFLDVVEGVLELGLALLAPLLLDFDLEEALVLHRLDDALLLAANLLEFVPHEDTLVEIPLHLLLLPLLGFHVALQDAKLRRQPANILLAVHMALQQQLHLLLGGGALLQGFHDLK